MQELTHISLFAGIGGIDLAAERAGFRMVLFVEIDSYCQKVLKKHWPDVPIIGDVRDATKERIMAYTQSRKPREQEAWNGRQNTSRGSQEEPLPNTISNREVGDKPEDRKGRGFEQEGEVMARNTKSNGGEKVTSISEGENSNTRGVCGTDRRPRRITSQPPITLVTGGFPCQPVSVAGKRRGTEDDRWLWPEMLRVISEVRPTWVVAENVTGLLHLGFYDCLSSLESRGYETIPFVIPACGVNAPHRRDRIFIVGYSLNNRGGTSRCSKNGKGEADNEGRKGWSQLGLGRCGKDVANSIIGTKGTSLGKGSNQGGANSKQDDRHGLGDDIGNRSKDVTDTNENRLQDRVWGNRGRQNQVRTSAGQAGKGYNSSWWATEPELGRVAYGIPNRVDRLKCLGNAVVPQQIYPILKAIADVEANK